MPTPPLADSALEARIARLSPAQRALLQRRLRESSADAAAGPLATGAEVAPLSAAQRRLWFLEQWDGGGGAVYGVVRGWWLRGGLDVQRLRAAVAGVVARHAALRTVFEQHDGEPRQRVLESLEAEWVAEDVRGGGRQAARQGAASLARRGYDLARGPLLRVGVWRSAEDEWLLVLGMHHIVSDGWSLGVLLREVSALYRGEALEPLALQYPDYALWQAGQQAQGAAGLEYWRSRLEGLTGLELPLDRPRPAQASGRGARVGVAVAPARVAALRAVGREAGATLYMVLLAALQGLLWRYTGQSDVAVGSPVAGRERPQFEGLIGCFINTLVLRADLSGEPSFQALLAQVKARALEAYGHAEVPFERLVEVLRPVRDASRHPLIQVLFALQNVPPAKWTLPDVEARVEWLETGTSKLDLSLTLHETVDGGLGGWLEYATDLFDAASAERLVGHYLRLLEAVAEAPEAAVGELEMMSAAERRQLLDEWNATARDYPRDASIASLFEAQVEARPEAVAVVCAGRELSYAELEQRANRLAHALLAAGVERGDRVGLSLQRSEALVVGLLGVLKAGAAYVPLDPGYPAARLEYMAGDADLAAVLVGRGAAAAWQGRVARVLVVDDVAERAGFPATPPVLGVNGGDLAYLMYTSGSTGQPKGVMVSHRAVLRLVCNTDYLRLGPDDRVAQVANANFDATTFEVWGALLNGARLVVLPHAELLDASALAAALQREDITAVFLTTALFNALIAVRPAMFSGLGAVLFGGETADPRRVAQCLSAGPPARLLHVYGPTECTTFATWLEVGEADLRDGSLAIGRPIANTRAYVVDAAGRPVPVGVPGELLLGGDGVALGYWRREALTRERFVADPWGAQGARLYRTGDRARWRADGTIDFLGREDQQIKLRGFRIEPGEIEAVLVEHPQVGAAVVTLAGAGTAAAALRAHVVVRGSAELEVAALREWLARRLADYQVPERIVAVDALPLTANGKLDRAALPEAAPDRVTSTGRGPRDQLELHLVKLLEDVLDRRGLNPDDDFFACGGHSLLAVELVDRVNAALGRQLPLDILWSHASSAAGLARYLRGYGLDGHNPERVQIRAGTRPPLFVVHTLGGNLFHYYPLARALAAEQAVIGLQARGVYGGTPDDSVEAIAAACVRVMRETEPDGPYRLAGFSSGGVVAFEIARQLVAAGIRVSLLALLDSYAPGVRARGNWARWWRRRPNQVTPWGQWRERARIGALRALGSADTRHYCSVGEAHRWAHWRYRAGPYPGAAVLFRATGSARSASVADLGWGGLVGGELRVEELPGTHGEMVHPPVVQQLAARLQGHLDASP